MADLGRTVAMRAECERFRGKHSQGGASDSGNVGLLSLGVSIGF